MKPLMSAGAVAALGLFAPIAADAADGYTITAVSLRAGPDVDYPRVTFLPAGTRLEINGCIDDWSWCDVSVWGRERGWVFGDYLQYRDHDRRYLIHDYGSRSGLPILEFALDTYWTTHYRNQRWYGDRDRWNSGGRHRHDGRGRDDRWQSPQRDGRDLRDGRDGRDRNDRHDANVGNSGRDLRPAQTHQAPAFQGGPQATAVAPPADGRDRHDRPPPPSTTLNAPVAPTPAAPAADTRVPAATDRPHDHREGAADREHGRAPPAAPADRSHPQGPKPNEPDDRADRRKRDDPDAPTNEPTPH